MTPQSSLMILAKVNPAHETDLRRLLASMNIEPGVVDPLNVIIPFAEFKQLHFARIVILDDQTLNDISVYGLKPVDYPTCLAILADFDGPADEFLAEFVNRSSGGLRRIFTNCSDFTPEVDLLRWTKTHSVSPAANYVNWIGRTVKQIGEEEALRQALESFLQEQSSTFHAIPPRQLREKLKGFVKAEQLSGRLALTAAERTPFLWQIRNFLHLVGIPFLFLICLPFLMLALPFLLIRLRHLEKTDPEVAPRVNPAHADLLASLEDHQITNQFSAMGSLKPGLFRRLTILVVLVAINYAARHIFNRGRLARVTSIQFARWVFLDGKKRVLFASNYDGSLESYMDDFINKVAFGLNVVFSNGIGYPRTNWLIADGAKDEQNFKQFLRRHQLPTEVWYNAHPGLTALNKWRNSLIRDGLEKEDMTDTEIEEWLCLF
jgi:hypothetical protein